ncbi:MAG: response regulator [Gemmatimonadetes bacterium]|nr:response regulator [Gemmatimonadota bacterium]MBK7351964.1 response regulator [Gemmatimonadota bacterium]MBK7784997.1 response regulator [Gemmatimonadota bacterium]
MPLADAPISVLVVDDEEPIRNALKKFLNQQGYDVVTAGSGDEALRVLQRQKVSVVLLDVRMPGKSGIDLVPQVLELEPSLAVLMLTAVNDATTAALCMQRGAMDYLTKPIDLSDLARAILRAIRRRDSQIEQANLNQWLKEEVAVRTAELRRERAKLERLSIATLEALVNALEAKDPYIRGHSARVADMGAMIAAELGMGDEQIEQVRMGGRLHDIGKIGIREDILSKEGPLTADEYELVKQHVVIGSQILSPLAHLGEIIAFVRSHHERWDGQGYPDHLKGEEIALGARVLAAAEIYDALTTARPYQEKMPPDVAVERMRDLAGSVLDPTVYHALEAAVRRRQALVFLDDARS